MYSVIIWNFCMRQQLQTGGPFPFYILVRYLPYVSIVVLVYLMVSDQHV
jgi:hypothetical protein